MDSPRVSEHDDRGTEKMWAWNYEIPGVTNKCIHDLFAEQVLAQPNAPAICAWDGKMSYSVLDNLSTTLAGYLVKIGVKPEDVVPLCFEKSMWTVVAMLAVLKAVALSHRWIQITLRADTRRSSGRRALEWCSYRRSTQRVGPAQAAMWSLSARHRSAS
ncbi:hypothetical protein CFE70_010637 [Pyrenophora teres f. teres 0-1]